MPFLRFSRDKRGYESTYLCHTVHDNGSPPQLRVLYWFRSPPNVEIGRPALDPETLRAIEASNPELRFDWDEILRAKPQPPIPEQAREGRMERRGRGRRRTRPASESAAPTALPAESPEEGQAKETESERDARPEGRRRTRRGGRGRRRRPPDKTSNESNVPRAGDPGPDPASATETTKTSDD